MSIVYGIALYVLVGVIIAVAFACVGVTHVLAQQVSLTAGARLLLLPGATALWPYVLVRWLMSGGRR